MPSVPRRRERLEPKKTATVRIKSEADTIDAKVDPDGTISFGMGGYKSEPSEEFRKSLMTLVYLGRIAAAMYSPSAASVPLSEEAADPEAVAAAVKAQADAAVKKIEAKAKAETAAKCPTGTCTDGSCADYQALK